MYDFFAITFSQDNLDDDNAKVISALLNNVNREFGKLGFPKKITVFRGGNIGSKNKFLFVCELNGIPGARIFADVGRSIISSENATLEYLGYYDEFVSWSREEGARSTIGIQFSDE
jgi:hypothetical protein